MYQQPPWQPQQPPSGRSQWEQQPPPPPNTYYPPQQPPQYQSGAYALNEPRYQPMPPIYPPPPVKQPPKKASRLWLWIVLCAVGVPIFGCIGFFTLAGAAAKNMTTGTINTSSTTSSSSSTNPSTSSQIAKVGQTITVDDVGATLVSVKTLAADQFIQPKPGNEFIVVHVKLLNNSSTEQAYNPFDFHVRSGSGNITDEEFAPPQSYTSNNQLNAGKLSTGGSVEGDIVFQVPKNDHKAQLTWQPNFLGNAGDNAWNLGL